MQVPKGRERYQGNTQEVINKSTRTHLHNLWIRTCMTYFWNRNSQVVHHFCMISKYNSKGKSLAFCSLAPFFHHFPLWQDQPFTLVQRWFWWFIYIPEHEASLFEKLMHVMQQTVTTCEVSNMVLLKTKHQIKVINTGPLQNIPLQGYHIIATSQKQM